MPNFEFENFAQNNGFCSVAGVDEAGRGSWAGPVVAGAVIMDKENVPYQLLLGLDDSKKLSGSRRKEYFDLLPTCSIIGIGMASVLEIDTNNILKASLMAMKRALFNLSKTPDHALIDGIQQPNVTFSCESIIKGDSRSYSIAAASVVAKVTRDEIMIELAKKYPDYGWEKNVGYGTAEHKKGLLEFGITKHHRKSYKPINNILSQQLN